MCRRATRSRDSRPTTARSIRRRSPRWSETSTLTFFDFPSEHWNHLRTSNVIESPFATVRLRQRVTKGAGSRTKGLLMAYKLVAMAPARWRRLNGADLLPLVRASIGFPDGVQQERKVDRTKTKAA